MTATKKSLRFLTVLALILAMVFSIMSVPASASSIDGVATWPAGSGYSSEFAIHGYNLTPVKTMGASGTLTLRQDFILTDLKTYPNAARCTVEIRTTGGTVLARATGVTSTETLTYGACQLHLSIPVTKGQQIQIYTSAYDVSTGVARRANLMYSYRLS